MHYVKLTNFEEKFKRKPHCVASAGLELKIIIIQTPK